MIDFSWVNAPLEGAALWLMLGMFSSAVFAGFMWAGSGFPLRRELKPGWVVAEGNRRLQTSDKNGWICIPNGTKFDLAGWRKNPDRLVYKGKPPYFEAEDLTRATKSSEPPPDRWAEYARDLELNNAGELSDEELLSKWRGKIPKKPAPPTDWAPPETSDARKARKKFIFDYGALTPLERKVMGADPVTLLPFMYTPPPPPEGGIHLMSPVEWAMYDTGWKCTCGRGHEAPMRRGTT